MNTEKQDEKVKKAINDHQRWVDSWVDRSGAFSREMVSPRGKEMTYSAYCFEVEKHMQKTIGKIRKILTEGDEK